jgi:hypothetical protein
MTPGEQKAMLEEYHNLRGKSTFDASLTGEWKKLEARILAMMSVPKGEWRNNRFLVNGVSWGEVGNELSDRGKTTCVALPRFSPHSYHTTQAEAMLAVESAFAKWWRSAQGVEG